VVTWQHTDALGTPVAITDSSKVVIERREYEPYGYLNRPGFFRYFQAAHYGTELPRGYWTPGAETRLLEIHA